MTVSLRDSVDLISDPRNLDASVEEIFRKMLGVNCQPCTATPDFGAGVELVTVVVGFGGVISGACVLKCDAPSAMRIVELMTGMTFAEIDETVRDGMGELGNLLAGTWKGQIAGLGAHCGLSIPAVITGREYRLRVRNPEFVIAQTYSLDAHSFMVTITCESVK